jgi:hypothetical protein
MRMVAADRDACTGAPPAIFAISQGVTITATKKEKIIAAEALAGMGLM